MNKRPCKFIIYLPLILQLVLFNDFNDQVLVSSCQSSPRVGKKLKIFETYKRRPVSGSSNENRIVKTLIFPKDYPTAGINNAYLDINSQISSSVVVHAENEVEESTTIFIRKEQMPSEEPITEDLPLLREEKYEGIVKTVNIESKKEGETTERNEEEGSGNDNDFQEKYIDNFRRRGELESTRKSSEDSSSIRKENGLLDDEEEKTGMHSYQPRNDVQERNGFVHKRNSDNLEYGKSYRMLNLFHIFYRKG